MKSRPVVFLAALALLTLQYAGATPRQVTNPAHRALEAQQQRRAAEQERRENQRPATPLIPPSPNQVIGKVSRVNYEQGFVVGWLHSRYLNLSGTIITRDERLRTTAVLSLGSARNNRAAGLRIHSGMPNVGDEIVIVTVMQQNTPPLSNPAQNANGSSGQNPVSTGRTWQGQPLTPQHAAPLGQQQPTPQYPPQRQQQTPLPQQAEQEPALIPAHRMRSISNVKPEVQTQITVTVE